MTDTETDTKMVPDTTTAVRRSAIDETADAVAVQLGTAIRETAATGSTEPAREVIARLARSDSEQDAATEEPSMVLVATLTLTSWLNEAQAGPGTAGDALGWIEATLGYRHRSGPGSAEPLWTFFAHTPHDDRLPALIWLLAALTVCHGGPGPGTRDRAGPG